MQYIEDLIVLFSGGADSTLLLELGKQTRRFPLALMIDYGQLHIQELAYAKKYLEKNNIKNLTVKLEGYNVNSALTGNGDQGLYKGVNIYNVPQRNTIFLSIAAGIAESRNINEVWFGASWEDYELKFPDCFQEYIGRMNKLLEISGVKSIKIYAPLLGMNKNLIKELLKTYNIKPNEIFSGYGEFA